jgi:hypothetical protein
VPAAPASAPSVGTGADAGIGSYWGILPERSDSVTAGFKNLPTPLWERALLAPYEVVRLPLRATAAGIGASYVYLDEHRVIYRVGRLIGPRRGPFGFTITVTAGGLTGWGGGVTLLHDAFLASTNRAKIRGQFSQDGGRRATVGLTFGHGRKVQNDFGAGYRLVPTARYFGLGPRSDRDDKSLYAEEQSWFAVGHTRRWSRGLGIEARAMVSGVGARASTKDDYPPVTEKFEGEVPYGYGHRSDAVSTIVALRHDTTSEDGRPSRGGVRRVTLARTDEFGTGRNSFWTYRADLEQFIPLWNSCQNLALRSFLSWSEPNGGSSIPFQRLLTNDDPDILRGYQDLRFRDRGMTALTVEYRWPVWAERRAEATGIDAYLLTDVGQVFGRREDLAVDQLTTSYGGGLRFIGGSGFVGRLEVARSEEETKVRLRADQLVQFARGGLYHGRNPIPLR